MRVSVARVVPSRKPLTHLQQSAPSKVQSERTYCELDGSGPPGCVCLNCEKEKRSESELIGEVCYENGTCTTLECLADPTSSPTCLPQSEKRSEAEPISVCFENGTCTTFECLNYPDSPTCLTQKEKRTVLPCAIGTICFENGTCTAFGCGDSPSPTTEKEKRSEVCCIFTLINATPPPLPHGPFPLKIITDHISTRASKSSVTTQPTRLATEVPVPSAASLFASPAQILPSVRAM